MQDPYNRLLGLSLTIISTYVFRLQFLQVHFNPIPCKHTPHHSFLLHAAILHKRLNFRNTIFYPSGRQLSGNSSEQEVYGILLTIFMDGLWYGLLRPTLKYSNTDVPRSHLLQNASKFSQRSSKTLKGKVNSPLSQRPSNKQTSVSFTCFMKFGTHIIHLQKLPRPPKGLQLISKYGSECKLFNFVSYASYVYPVMRLTHEEYDKLSTPVFHAHY